MLRALVAGSVLVCALPLLVIVIVVALLSAASGAREAHAGLPPAAVVGDIPPEYMPLYSEAARVFEVSPWLLAAIHKHETGFSTHPDTYRINFAGCCIGPMQMNVRDGTWRSVEDAYRKGVRPAEYPHPDAPHGSPTDSFDAIMAAAKLLRLKVGGATVLRLDDVAWRAARNYAGAGPVADRYADEVLELARGFAAAASRTRAEQQARLQWPVPRSAPVTSPFCERRSWEACHPGVDLGVPLGTPVIAAAPGRVTMSGWVSGYGKFVCIQHAARLATCYAHLSRIADSARLGAVVEPRGLVGWSGCTGRCFGPHLHFEVRLGAGLPAAVADPMDYLG